MFKRLYNEATLKLCIEPEGPLLIKASESGADPTRPDMEFVRTVHRGRETVYLPGSTLKGVIRAHCERLARTVQSDEVAGQLSEGRLSCDPLHESLSCSQQWEGSKGDAQSEEIYRRSCFICRMFGNTRLAGRVRVTDAYPDEPDGIRTEERNGVAIDRVFGSVAVGPFNYEVVTRGIFTCRIQVRNFTIAQLGLLALALRDLEMRRIGIGFARSRGLGRVRARVAKATFRYPACTVDAVLRLVGSNRPGTPATQLVGVGEFAPGDGYGLNADDTAALPEGVALKEDNWGEPYLTLTDDARIKALWRECVRAWRRVVERAVSQT